MKKGQITAPLELVELYKAKVDHRLHRDVDRMLQTLTFYVDRGVTPKELQTLLDHTETWQTGRVWGQGLTVFTAGFFLLGAYGYINARHGDALVFSPDPQRPEIERFVWGCLIAGFGGVFGSNVIGKGGLAPGYFTPLAFDSDGKAYKDGKANDFMTSTLGKFVEGISFWGFSAAYAVVEACFGAHPKDPALKAGVKWASACLVATPLTCLTKQLLPRLLLPRDSLLLDASTPEKRAAIEALLQHRYGKNWCADLGDYGRAFGKGFKANIGWPSKPEVVRAVLHSCSAAVALAGLLASQEYPDHADVLAMVGSVWLGLYWGLGSRISRCAIDQIKQAGVADAARAQERTRAAAEREQAREGKSNGSSGRDEEQGVHVPLDSAASASPPASSIAPPKQRRRNPCDACVIV